MDRVPSNGCETENRPYIYPLSFSITLPLYFRPAHALSKAIRCPLTPTQKRGPVKSKAIFNRSDSASFVQLSTVTFIKGLSCQQFLRLPFIDHVSLPLSLLFFALFHFYPSASASEPGELAAWHQKYITANQHGRRWPAWFMCDTRAACQ